MKRQLWIPLASLIGLLSLGGCGEKPQSMGGNKHHAPAFEGVGASPYAQAGWKAGDRGSWEQGLKARAQHGQNDYTRMGN